jgi:hypothetical protein
MALRAIIITIIILIITAATPPIASVRKISEHQALQLLIVIKNDRNSDRVY